MKAVIMSGFGGPEVLSVGDCPDPQPGPGDLLVRVRATALNRADLLQRRGLYPPPPGASDVLGLEMAGEVVSAGPECEGQWRPGERVCALLPGGGYAELAAVPANMAMRIPDGMSFEEAAAIPEVFLTAYIGLSGVNFGVAENGLICLLTNEGNGRMVTTLPPVHIALMGIERLVPTLEDLAVMLYLLPRSATGQKLTVYTSLIRSPNPGDGCQERHLVLVDNGRLALRNTPLKEALYCIRCGACFNACPVFREIGGHGYVGKSGQHTSYGGPIGSILSGGLFGYEEFGHLARASSLCGACREACPVDIDLPGLLLRVRAGKVGAPTSPKVHMPNAPASLKLGIRLFSLIATHPRMFYLAQKSAALLSRLISPASSWLRLPSVTGWGVSKDFPRPAQKPFRQQWKEMHHNTSISTPLLQSEEGDSRAGIPSASQPTQPE
ncbi:MAG: LUD domain-containing protein, partial [Alicyclobacillus sp.]|nr:LUD domain-containing protein [Alicyclobacillus sp.]